MKMCRCKPSGFTLVEMAIVLVIIGLLLGGMMMPLSAQMDQRRNSETQKTLDEINQALIGYAIVKGYLPCPAISSSNGAEDRTGTACTGGKRLGFVPWAELGVTRADAWGRLFRYSVRSVFSDSGTKFTLSSTGDIAVKNDNSAADIATAIPALVMSHGKNGRYATMPDAAAAIADDSATNADEDTNGTVAGTTFVSKAITDNIDTTANPGGEFDDLVTWLSPNILFNRMVAAGKLP